MATHDRRLPKGRSGCQRLRAVPWVWTVSGLCHQRRWRRAGRAGRAGVAQYAVAQLVGAAWARPYSLKSNYISDLGITACGLFHVRHGTSYYECSPGHGLANASFVIFGALRIAGAVLLRGIRPAGHLARRALILWTLSGPGKVIGLVPENTRIGLHSLPR